MRFGKYNYIDTVEKLEAMDAFLMEDDSPKFGLVSLDTETNGLELYKTIVVGFSISTDSKSGFYIPLLEWVPDPKSLKTKKIDGEPTQVYEHGWFEDVWRDRDRYEEFSTPKEYQPPKAIVAFLARWMEGVNCIMHNGPFDVNQLFVNFGLDFTDNLLLDTALLAHILNENTPNGLKPVSEEWKEALGINPHAMANVEQQELGASIIKNGGTYNARTKHVWRADPKPMGKYGCADTFLTYGVYEVGIQKFIEDYGEDMLDWLFEQEVMPVCKEVVIGMKRKGVYIDAPYFEALRIETGKVLEDMEDEIISEFGELIEDFSIGKSVDEAISKQRVIKRIIELEGLPKPMKYDKKTDTHKYSIAKGVIKKMYQEEPHWLWGYIMGEDEIQYSTAKLNKIKAELYHEVVGRRYRFNIGSDAHLRWLFCDKLGHDKTKLPQTDSATKDNPIPSMKAEVLEEYFKEEYPFVEKLLVWKKLRKLQSTYISPACELNQDGWLYMDMKQNGTKSGRFACSGGFNLQTLPKVEEIEFCSKCKSENITQENPIELLANVTCNDCGHVDEGILCPSAIKKGFIAPPGYKIVNADYSSLEPRCFAFVSGDDKLKEIYWKDLDMYSKIYCDMEGEEYRNLKKSGLPGDKDNRNMIKPVALGIPYGARGPQVANLMGLKKTYRDKKSGELKEVLDVEAGWEKRDQYLETYEDLHNYMTTMENDCVSKGYVKTLIGRKRHYIYAPFVYEVLSAYGVSIEDFLDAKHKSLEKPNTDLGLDKEGIELFCKRFKKKYFEVAEKGFWGYIRALFKQEYNNSKNHPIQGLAGHITNRGMLDTNRKFAEQGLDAWVCLQVHDEITCYAREDQAEAASELLRDGMENNEFAKRIDIAMIADPLIADNLKEAK